MCTNPVIIKNNSTTFHPLYSPRWQVVPCSRCFDCQQSRSRDWQVRAYYEFLNCQKLGGQTFFYTLTFNKYYLPTYYGVRCFDWTLVDGFIKRLRNRLSKLGITLKLLITSEYGELFARPHHHALFYLYGKQISPTLFRKIVQDSWSFYHQENDALYPFGNVMPGDNHGVVDSYRAVLYVCKYVCKDFSFASSSYRIFLNLVREYLNTYVYPFNESLPSFRSLRNPKIRKTLSSYMQDICNQFIRDFKHKLPFVKYSLGFGSCASEHLTPALLKSCKILMPSRDTFVEVSLPRYLVRKIYFDRVLNPHTGKYDLYRLNERGVDFFTNKVFSDASSVLADNDNLYSYALNNLRDDYELSSLFEYYDSIRHLLPFYSFCYRYFIEDYDNPDMNFSDDVLRSRVRDIIVTRSIFNKQDYETSQANYSHWDKHYSDASPFEQVQSCLDQVSLYLSRLKSEEKESSERLRRIYKQKLKLRNYALRQKYH